MERATWPALSPFLYINKKPNICETLRQLREDIKKKMITIAYIAYIINTLQQY